MQECHKQADTQTQTHTDKHRHRHRHTDTQTHRHTDTQNTRHTDTHQLVVCLDGGLGPVVADGNADGLSKEAVARVAHETHTRICSPDNRTLDPVVLVRARAVQARLVLADANRANEAKVVGQLHAKHGAGGDKGFDQVAERQARFCLLLCVRTDKRKCLPLEAVQHHACQPGGCGALSKA